MSELHTAGVREAAARLRRLDTAMRIEYDTALAGAAKVIIAAARVNAAGTLPRRGGLAALVAKSGFTVRRLRSGHGGGLRITVVGHDPRLDTQGRLRHPVFGHDRWVGQKVRPGWFTRAAKRADRQARAAMEAATRKVAARIAGRAA